MWKAGAVYASLERLRETVAEHADREDMRMLFEYHSARVAGLVASQPEVPASEATIAGFLNGFRTAATALADDPGLSADTMFPQLGGIYLYAVATLDAHDGTPDAGAVGFFARLSETLEREPVYLELTEAQHQFARELVLGAFAETPEVPINGASLAGFVLGLLYATPFVGEDGTVPVVALMGAARALLPEA
jgi:hypothetical protein